MFYAPFYHEFPKIAEFQTRVLSVLISNDGELPIGDYSFIDAFCTDKKCDCRRAMIYIHSSNQRANADPISILSYGWEPKPFYKKLFPQLPSSAIDWFKGPGLDPYQPQSEHAGKFLEHFLDYLQDEKYRNRIIRHYIMYKQKIGMKIPKDLEIWSVGMQDCGCRSGLKFKFCCGAK